MVSARGFFYFVMIALLLSLDASLQGTDAQKGQFRLGRSLQRRRGMRRKGATKVAIRINCGASRGRKDRAGNVWLADTYGTGMRESAEKNVTVPVSVPNGQAFIYTSETFGRDFGYNIPVPAVGAYWVSLRFAELYVNATDERLFNVFIQDNQLVPALPNLDPFKLGGGFARPVEKIIPVYTADKYIRIRLVGIKQLAQICGIVIKGPIRGRQFKRLISPPPPSPPPSPPSPPPPPSSPPPPPSPPPTPLTSYPFPGNFRPVMGASCIKPFNGIYGQKLSFDLHCPHGSRIVSLERFQYGSFVATMKVTPKTTRGLISSFYMATPDSMSSGALLNQRDELDFEYKRGGGLAVLQTNWFANGIGGHEVNLNTTFSPSKRVQRYRINWYPDYIEFMLNGVRVTYYDRNSTNFPTRPMEINFVVWAAGWAGPIDLSKAPFSIVISGLEIHPLKRFPPLKRS